MSERDKAGETYVIIIVPPSLPPACCCDGDFSLKKSPALIGAHGALNRIQPYQTVQYRGINEMIRKKRRLTLTIHSSVGLVKHKEKENGLDG